ncbi:pyridoxamine 5'-phosphate oxidase [candidate division MSBL1 archaeon SCGC-AAA259I07]|uniref:Pyridoxamine 5'-phosphate oxidase n=1 Tax=candidate division MSBL1 archaeon SCGC-AAA259I07 TaxID=1698266 RepID=A0A133UMM9_9EURY|nr:pyridoxamine 5'-phosphate oxidase [candidate division MSBL1 archaeon SCGC-AAA259I07]
MKLKKLPLMQKKEYDELIKNQFMCRISFKGEKYPQIKPFLYVFDGKYLYFLATKYGEKLRFIDKDPHVTVEIENYTEDLSDYRFVTLSGKLEKVEEEEAKKEVRGKFVRLIKERDLSKVVMTALGHSKNEPVENIAEKERNIVLKLVDVEDITGLKKGD